MRIINVTKNVDRLNLALTVEKRHLNSQSKILGGGTEPTICRAFVSFEHAKNSTQSSLNFKQIALEVCDALRVLFLVSSFCV